MKKIHFTTETDGFYGVYWKCKNKSDAAMILMLGDDPEDFMAKSGILLSGYYPDNRNDAK